MAFAFVKSYKIAHRLITNNSLCNIYAGIRKKMWNDYLVWNSALANRRMDWTQHSFEPKTVELSSLVKMIAFSFLNLIGGTVCVDSNAFVGS